MRPLYCKIKNGEWGYNGAFCLSRGFFAMIFEPTGTWFLSLICPRIEHVSVTCWGYTNIQTISVVYALACLANVSKWINERESSFIPLFCSRSDFLDHLAQKPLPQAGHLFLLQRTDFILPSNHQNMSRNSIWLVSNTELLVWVTRQYFIVHSQSHSLDRQQLARNFWKVTLFPTFSMDIKTLLDNLHDEVSCSVCMCAFTDPKQLPRFHSFCLHCLNGIQRTSGVCGKITCPECKRQFQIPGSGDPSELPTNFRINNLLDALAMKECSTANVKCGNCDKRS